MDQSWPGIGHDAYPAGSEVSLDDTIIRYMIILWLRCERIHEEYSQILLQWGKLHYHCLQAFQI